MVEVMIASSLASFVLASILSSFLFIGRSGVNAVNYNDMETQARRALEIFAEDTRQASAISWTNATTVTMTVNTHPVTYTYIAANRAFYRDDGTGNRPVLTGIVNFTFVPYSITAQVLPLITATDLAIANARTKQLQISLRASRTNQTVVDATNTVLSARFILRNKVVTT